MSIWMAGGEANLPVFGFYIFNMVINPEDENVQAFLLL